MSFFLGYSLSSEDMIIVKLPHQESKLHCYVGTPVFFLCETKWHAWKIRPRNCLGVKFRFKCALRRKLYRHRYLCTGKFSKILRAQNWNFPKIFTDWENIFRGNIIKKILIARCCRRGFFPKKMYPPQKISNFPNLKL